MAKTKLTSLNVLVIDDQELARRAVAAVLEKIGVAHVTVADDGVVAIENLRRNEPDIDLVVCDIDMPAKTGWEFVSEIRGGAVPGKEDIPILMLTGLDTDYAMAGDQHRIDGFISKPPTLNRLRDHMTRVMGFGPAG